MIKKYKQFIQESLKELPTDSVEVARDKKDVNDLSKWIADYKSKKTTLLNIYLTYTDDRDLMIKLKAKNFIENFEVDRLNPQKMKSANVQNPKRMRFTNPLLDEYADIAVKRRQLKDLNVDLEKQKELVEKRQDDATQNTNLKGSFEDDIKAANDKVSKLNQEIQRLEQEVKTLESEMPKRISRMAQEYNKKNALLSQEIASRTQTDINTEK